MANKIQGIDISNNNGIINFKKVKTSGKAEIVYIKASEGNYYRDRFLDQNYTNAKANGLKVGFYHFFKVDKDAKAQAQFFVNAIKGKTPDCIHMCDIELACGKNITEVSNAVITFIEEVVRLTGQETGIYTYSGFAPYYLNISVTKYKLWIANYCNPNKTVLCKPWNLYIGHQYSEKGSVCGIKTNVDMDIFTPAIYLNSASANTKPSKKPSTITKAKNTASTVINKIKNIVTKPSIQLDTTIILCNGDNNDNVKKMQIALNKLIAVKYFKADKLVVDGKFGDTSEIVVKAFQSAYNLTVDGKFGRQSAQKINEIIKQYKL